MTTATKHPTTTREYGILISVEPSSLNDYSSRITAQVICREDGKDHPINPKSSGAGETGYDGAPAHLVGHYLDGFGIYGFVSTSCGDAHYIGTEFCFRSPYAVEAETLKAMTRTMTRIERLAKKELAVEPGDLFMVLARALKLTFAVTKAEGSSRSGSFYQDSDWHFMPIESGREHFRRLIAKAKAEAADAKTKGLIAA